MIIVPYSGIGQSASETELVGPLHWIWYIYNVNMDEMIARRNGHEILGPNVLIGRRIAPVSEMESVKRAWNISPPSQVAGRSLSSRTDSSSSSKATCSSSDASNTCEKPMGSNVATEITVAVV